MATAASHGAVPRHLPSSPLAAAPAAPAAPPVALLTYTAADAAVDYDENVTALYEHIGNSAWDAATERCRRCPPEAATWVVRHRRDAAGRRVGGAGPDGAPGGGLLWRFLPLHSACALDPNPGVVRALLRAHPAGPRTLDGQGLLALHYACGARCSREVLYLLLMAFPQAARREDPNGMLPLHYLAQWGPRTGDPGALDLVCAATGREAAGSARDGDGHTAEALARRADYPDGGDVARRIREFAAQPSTPVGTAGAGAGGDATTGLRAPASPARASSAGTLPRTPSRSDGLGGGLARTSSAGDNPRGPRRTHLSVRTSPAVPPAAAATPASSAGAEEARDKYSSFEDDAAELIDNTTLVEHAPEGDIEISLSNNALSSPASVYLGSGGRFAFGRSGGRGSGEGGGRAGPTADDHENTSVWGNRNDGGGAALTPRSCRYSMGKLGVSPVHSARDRYQLWGGGSEEGAAHYDGGLNRLPGHVRRNEGASPRRHARGFSWDRFGAVPEAREDAQSTDGSTWTTALELPSAPAPAAPCDAIPSPPADNSGATAAATIATSRTKSHPGPPLSPRSSQHQRNNGLSPVDYAPARSVSSVHLGKTTSVTASSTKSYPGSSPLPPRSPRLVVPKGRAQHPRSGRSQQVAASAQPLPTATQCQRNQPVQHPMPPSLRSFTPFSESPSVQREQGEESSELSLAAMSEKEEQDRRLSELREELSAFPAITGADQGLPGGSGNDAHSSGFPGSKKTINRHNGDVTSSSVTGHSPQSSDGLIPISSVGHLSHQRAVESPTVINETLVSSNTGEKSALSDSGNSASSDVASVRSGLSGTTHCSSASNQSSTTYGAQLTQHLQVVVEAEELEKQQQQQQQQQWQGQTQVESKNEGTGRSQQMCLKEEREHMERLLRENERLKAENEHQQKVRRRDLEKKDAAVEEQARSEKALRSEISKLRDEKERAEEVLSTISSLAPVLSISDNDENDDDDVVSKLTWLEHEKEKVEMEPLEEAKRALAMSPVEEIEIKTEEDTGKSASGKSQVDVNCVSGEKVTAKATHALSTTQQRAKSNTNIAELMERITAQALQLDLEKTKSTGLEMQMKALRAKTEQVTKNHSEVAHGQLKEVKSLRESLDKAMAEIKKLRRSSIEQDELARDSEKLLNSEAEVRELRSELDTKSRLLRELESRLAMKERSWNEEREKLKEDASKFAAAKEREWNEQNNKLKEDIKVLNDKYLAAHDNEQKTKEANDRVATKEREWEEQRRKLEEEVKDLNNKYRMVKDEEQTAHTLMKEKETEWYRHRERLEMELEQLRKEGKYSGPAMEEAKNVVTSKKREWYEQRRQLEEEIKELNSKCQELQNDAHKTQAEMKEKETLWTEHRGRLETELQQLKKKAAELVSSDSARDSEGRSGSRNITLQIELDNATTEAEDMRKFNAAIRKEHDATVAELEAELGAERSRNTESLSQIVTLQFTVATLEQDLENAREETARAATKATEAREEADAVSAQVVKAGYDLKDAKKEAARSAKLAARAREETDCATAEAARAKQEAARATTYASRARKEAESAKKSRVGSTIDSGGSRNEEAIELELYQLKDKLQEKIDKAELSRKTLDEMNLELQQTEKALKKEAESAHSALHSLKLELEEKERMFQKQLEKAEERADKAEDRVRQFVKDKLQEQLDDECVSRDFSDEIKFRFEEKERVLQQQLNESKNQLNESEKQVRQSEGRVRKLEIKEERQALKLKEEQQISLTQMQQIHDLKEKIKLLKQCNEEHSQKMRETHKLRERALEDKRDNCAAALTEALGRVQWLEEQVRQLEAREEHHAPIAMEENLEQIRNLKKQIKLLQHANEEHSQKLREASKLRERAIQDKEEAEGRIRQFESLVRQLEVKEEKATEEKKRHLQQIDDLKKKQQEHSQNLWEVREEYLQQINDFKETQQEHTQNLWEANKLQERAIRDREEAEDRICQLKKRVQQLEAKEEYRASELEEGSEVRERYLQQIENLEKEIKLLQQNNMEHSRELREANRLRERAIQDKEDECAATLEEAESRVRKFEDRVQQLEAKEEHHASEVKKERQIALTYVQQIHELKRTIERLQQNSEAQTQTAFEQTEGRVYQLEDRIRELEAQEKHQVSKVKEVSKVREGHLQQILVLKKKIVQLEQSNEQHIQKLWEANKLREDLLKDKEDDIDHQLRELRIQHDKTLRAKEVLHLKEMQGCKKKSELMLIEEKQVYRQQLLDGEKREQALAEKEEALQKELNEEKMKVSFSETKIDTLLDEINNLHKEGNDATDDRMIANELETQLLERKKDLTQQRRKYRSEMNKLNNTMELQKSKEERLQSHIQSLEKQISDMVSDYELKLEESLYDHM